MVAIKNVLLFAIPAFSAAILERDVATINKDLATIDSDVKALTSAVQKFDGSSSAALSVLNAESKLDNDIKQGTKDAQATSPVSSTDCVNTVNYINNTLEPDVKASINALVAKKSTFASAGYQSTVCNDLKTLKSDTDSFASTLVGLCPSGNQAAATSAKNKIDADFQTGITAYC